MFDLSICCSLCDCGFIFHLWCTLSTFLLASKLIKTALSWRGCQIHTYIHVDFNMFVNLLVCYFIECSRIGLTHLYPQMLMALLWNYIFFINIRLIDLFQELHILWREDWYEDNEFYEIERRDSFFMSRCVNQSRVGKRFKVGLTLGKLNCQNS